MLLSLSAPVNSVSSPTALATPYHPPTSRGPQNREPSFHGKMNREQKPRVSSTLQVQCMFCEQLDHLISTYRKRERLYGPSITRSLVVADSTLAPTPQSSLGFLLSDQLSQITSYLTSIYIDTRESK